jgi:hypothetical protein
MVFDEDKLAEMRGKGADFKESYDMGTSRPPPQHKPKLIVRQRDL